MGASNACSVPRRFSVCTSVVTGGFFPVSQIVSRVPPHPADDPSGRCSWYFVRNYTRNLPIFPVVISSGTLGFSTFIRVPSGFREALPFFHAGTWLASFRVDI